MEGYILGIDQSTQGTKALLFDAAGGLVGRADVPHKQWVDEKGWVEHNLEEIYQNTVAAVKNLVEQTGIDRSLIRAAGISNQRETAAVWEKESGKPVGRAIVWQCARGAGICERIAAAGHEDLVKEHTGLNLSPYFSAAKIAWVLQNVPGAGEKASAGELCCGTIDSWLVYCLTGKKVFRTDYSNASRTQMMNLHNLVWDQEVCDIFGIPIKCLAEITPSDGEYGLTDFAGFLDQPIPIRAVMGDSHGALFGQGCHWPGMLKATYGTGSSVMMNIGGKPLLSEEVVSSVGWFADGKVQYVLEGNINYTGAVITWLKEELGLISSPEETEMLAGKANPEDKTYLVPAFSGLSAPYWDSNARAMISGMSRTTGKAEIVKAALESIAYQIADVVQAMEAVSGIKIAELRVDGGPTRNTYLMQFQSDILNGVVRVPEVEELSGMGVAYMAGIASGFYERGVLNNTEKAMFVPQMEKEQVKELSAGWQKAVAQVLFDKPA